MLHPASALPPPLHLRKLPFVRLCSVRRSWVGHARGSLSAVPGMLLAVHRVCENEPWAFATALTSAHDTSMSESVLEATTTTNNNNNTFPSPSHTTAPRAGWVPRACLSDIDLAAVMPAMLATSELCHIVQLFQATRDLPAGDASVVETTIPPGSALVTSATLSAASDVESERRAPASPGPSGPSHATPTLSPLLACRRDDTLLITGMTRTGSHYHAFLVTVGPDGDIETRGQPGWLPVTAATPRARQYATCEFVERAYPNQADEQALQPRFAIADLNRASQSQLFSSFRLYLGPLDAPMHVRFARLLDLPSPPSYSSTATPYSTPVRAQPGKRDKSQISVSKTLDGGQALVEESQVDPIDSTKRLLRSPHFSDEDNDDSNNADSSHHRMHLDRHNVNYTDDVHVQEDNDHTYEQPQSHPDYDHNGDGTTSAAYSTHFVKVTERTPLPTLYRGPPYFNIIMVMTEICFLLIGLGRGGIQSHDNPMLGPSFNTLKQLGARWPPTLQEGHVYQLITSLFVPVGVIRFCADVFVHLLVGIWVERNLGFWRTASVFFGAGLVGNISGAIFVPSWLVAGPAPGLFGYFGAYLWLILRPSMGFAPINFSGNMNLFSCTDSASARVEPDMSASTARRNSLLVRVFQWRSVVTFVLLLVGLVLGPFPGSDNWSQVMALLPGGALALLLDPAPVARHKKRDRGSICVTALHCLCAVILMKFVLFYLVTDVEQVCDWCIRSTCYAHGDWCDPIRRLGLDISTF
jgi:membrane associated rhomboid family serine protease